MLGALQPDKRVEFNSLPYFRQSFATRPVKAHSFNISRPALIHHPADLHIRMASHEVRISPWCTGPFARLRMACNFITVIPQQVFHPYFPLCSR